MSALAPIYSAGAHLYICNSESFFEHGKSTKWKPKMFTLLNCLIGKVQTLTLAGKMRIDEFLFIKERLLKDVTFLNITFFDKDVSLLFYPIIGVKTQN